VSADDEVLRQLAIERDRRDAARLALRRAWVALGELPDTDILEIEANIEERARRMRNERPIIELRF